MKKTKSKTKKILISVIAIILIGAVSFAAYSYIQGGEKADTNNDSAYTPPTDEEALAGDTRKEQIAKDEAGSRDGSTANTVATVVITYAEQNNDVIEINAFSEHYEDGICTIVFTQGAQKVTKDTPAYRDARTTICTNPLIKRSDFPTSGSWTVQVLYASGSANGSSAIQTITII